MKKLYFLLIGLMILPIGLINLHEAKAQNLCNQGVPCTDDAQCQDFSSSGVPQGGCPPCMGCVGGFCQPSDALCDDGSDCTVDFCFFTDIPMPPDPNGCQYFSLATQVPPDPNLPIECYICEPTANNVLVDNGICDETAGENCSNSPDCQEAGVPCGPPPTPPVQCLPTANQPEPPCQDGDRCTDDICTVVIGTTVITQCSNPPKTCDPVPDGCCPANCTGPDPNPQQGAEPCFDPTGAPIPGCDADCWYPQSCGDGQVQPPETCDDAADQGNAGISPTGAVVSNETCRDPGTAGECTYCGDGIVQTAAGEECDLNNTTACGTEGCDQTTCLCNIVTNNLCITGSGKFWTDIRPGCANCGLNKAAVTQGTIKDYFPFLGIGILMALGFGLRRRNHG